MRQFSNNSLNISHSPRNFRFC